jgi:hypothetical protein
MNSSLIARAAGPQAEGNGEPQIAQRTQIRRSGISTRKSAAFAAQKIYAECDEIKG